MERMREEIDSVIGKSRLILETDLPNLPYLQAVVNEGLRLYPPIPVFGRRLQEGCVMGGFYVHEKTTLVVSGYAVMRDSDYWENPDDFKPERFLASSGSEQEDATKEKVLKYLPFEGDKVNMDETLSGMVLTMAHPLKCTPIPQGLPISKGL
ncbi:hypothetical protein Bca101_003262 [Brassica carinata]